MTWTDRPLRARSRIGDKPDRRDQLVADVTASWFFGGVVALPFAVTAGAALAGQSAHGAWVSPAAATGPEAAFLVGAATAWFLVTLALLAVLRRTRVLARELTLDSLNGPRPEGGEA